MRKSLVNSNHATRHYPRSAHLLRPLFSAFLYPVYKGFVASQVIETLLRAPDGLFVRFTSRSTSRIEKSTEHFSQKFGSHRICGLLVEHPELPGAYDEAVEGEFKSETDRSWRFL